MTDFSWFHQGALLGFDDCMIMITYPVLCCSMFSIMSTHCVLCSVLCQHTVLLTQVQFLMKCMFSIIEGFIYCSITSTGLLLDFY